jgi:uncharacterized protein
VSQEASTLPAAPRWKRWLLLSPLARIVIFMVLLTAMGAALRALFASVGWLGKGAPLTHHHLATFILQLVPPLTAYLFVVYRIEKRRPVELAWRKVLPHGLSGFAAGVLLISAVVGVLWLVGSYIVIRTNPEPHWFAQFAVSAVGAAIAEEIITRGALFRIAEEGLGTWGALLVSALLFGFGHAANPNATPWSSLAIAIEAGLLLGMLYHVSRSLPLCMGVHAGWNFAEGTIWGVPVSGSTEIGWLVSLRAGPDWLSGGAFGAESSVVAVALCSVVTIALLAIALRRRTIVPPWFRRGRAAAALRESDNGAIRPTPSC